MIDRIKCWLGHHDWHLEPGAPIPLGGKGRSICERCNKWWAPL